MIDKNTPH